MSSKTITRWLSGRHVPGPRSAQRIALWVRDLP
ncbi:MAG: hypothetical protein JSS23_12350 [Proteobacteria bacterium]|nr:hypothetical protein [Pseudomonadota bacterium]